MRALAVISLLAATPAFADDTFEAKASTAQRITRMDDLVWALTAACDEGSDTQQRQCRRIRDARVAQLANATLIVEAERDAFSVGAWNAAKKSSALSLSACIRCNGVEVNGKTWFVVATKVGAAAPRFEGGKLKTSALHDNAKSFADEAAAKKFSTSTAAAKIELLVKVPAKPAWSIDGKRGLSLDVQGYRVVSPCDGSVVLASHASAVGEVDKKACAAGRATVESPGSAGARSGAEGRRGELIDALSQADIKESLKPALDAAKDCYAKYKVRGKAKLRITVAADGSIAEYEQQGDFAGSPTGQCIDGAVKAVAFPPSKKPKTAFSMPVTLP